MNFNKDGLTAQQQLREYMRKQDGGSLLLKQYVADEMSFSDGEDKEITEKSIMQNFSLDKLEAAKEEVMRKIDDMPDVLDTQKAQLRARVNKEYDLITKAYRQEVKKYIKETGEIPEADELRKIDITDKTNPISKAMRSVFTFDIKNPLAELLRDTISLFKFSFGHTPSPILITETVYEVDGKKYTPEQFRAGVESGKIPVDTKNRRTREALEADFPGIKLHDPEPGRRPPSFSSYRQPHQEMSGEDVFRLAKATMPAGATATPTGSLSETTRVTQGGHELYTVTQHGTNVPVGGDFQAAANAHIAGIERGAFSPDVTISAPTAHGAQQMMLSMKIAEYKSGKNLELDFKTPSGEPLTMDKKTQQEFDAYKQQPPRPGSGPRDEQDFTFS